VSTIRINKFFTEQGFCSRRSADHLIVQGRVLINGIPASLGDQVSLDDIVIVDGHVLNRRHRPVYLAYNKPVGVTCTTERNVDGNIIDAVGYPGRIFPIGRLDKDSSGLILLTNDGDIVNKILRAEFGHEREYLVTLDRPYASAVLERLERGVTVLGKKTSPCLALKADRLNFRIILTEGKNRQIRRMCAAVGYRVVRLVRLRMMHIRLDNLRAGEWRHLSTRERKVLLAAVGHAGNRSA
jgi:23S rRNA pseudouridine2604 synthase